MPAGLESTVPAPEPASVTDSGYAIRVNVAVTALAAVIVTLHAPVPLHAPDQPANVDPVAALAVSNTTVPWVKLAEQVVPHEMPAGLDVTVPLPEPARVTA